MRSRLIAQTAKINASVRRVIVNGATPTNGNRANSAAPATTTSDVSRLARASSFNLGHSPATEDACRTNNKRRGNNQEQERGRPLCEIAAAYRFGQRNEESSDRRSGQAAQPAEDHDQKRVDEDIHPHLRMDGKDRRTERTG